MNSVAKSLVASLVSDLQVPSGKASEIVTLRDLVLYLTDEANASLLLERKVTPAATIEVANRAITASARRPLETQIFNAVRSVRSFLTLAATGTEKNLDINVYDLLPIGHPLSTATSVRTNENISKQRVAWIAAASNISDEVRPLVASAFSAAHGSMEQRYAFAFLASLPAGQVPAELLDVSAVEAITAGLGDGNSRAARSARAKLQRRDRKGRFAWMGGRGKFKLKVAGPNGTRQVIERDGIFVGGASKGKLRILVKGEKGIPDKVYLVSPDNFELYDTKDVVATLTPEQLAERNIGLDDKPQSVGEWSNDAIPNLEDIDTLEINSLDQELADKGLSIEEVSKVPSYRAGSPLAKLPAGKEADPDFDVTDEIEKQFNEGSFAERFAAAEDVKIKALDAFISKSFAETKEYNEVPPQFKKYAKSDKPVTSALDAYDAGELDEKGIKAYMTQVGFGVEADNSLGGKKGPLLAQLKKINSAFDAQFDKSNYDVESKTSKVVAELPESAVEPDLFDAERGESDPDYAAGYVEGMDQTIYDGPQEVTPDNMPEDWSDSKKDGYEQGFRRGEVLREKMDEYLSDSGEKPENADGNWSSEQLGNARDAVAEPEFRKAFDVDVANDKKSEVKAEIPKPTPPPKTAYSGARYSDWKNPPGTRKLDTAKPYQSDGLIEDISDGLATDDPAKLANIFTKDELEEGLSNSIVDGEAMLKFPNDTDESPIPGEAVYEALRQQGIDPDLTLAQAYDFLAGGQQNYDDVIDFKMKANVPEGGKPTIDTIDETVPRQTKEKVLAWNEMVDKAYDLMDSYRDGFEGDESFQQIADYLNNPMNANAKFGDVLEEFEDWASSDDVNKRSAFQGLVGIMAISDADSLDLFGALESISEGKPDLDLTNLTYENLVNSKFKVAKGTEDPNDQSSLAGNTYRVMALITKDPSDLGDLYRGIQLVGQGDLAKYYTTEGNLVSFDQRPFSRDQKTSESFAGQNVGSTPKQDFDSVLFTIEESNVRGLDTKLTSTYAYEEEVLVADRFRVASVETSLTQFPNGKVRRNHVVKLERVDAEAEQESAPSDLSSVADLSDYKQVSGPQGSNQGGVYENSNGEQIYVKEPKTQLHGENEVLASVFYDAAGLNTAEIRKGKLANGKEVTFSPMIESDKDFSQKVNDAEYRKKVQEGFAVDAWLANWDVAGTGFDNIVTDKNGEPVRVDPGGALLFRAQGAPKGGAFGEEVAELDSLLDSNLNSYSAKTFGDMTEEDKAESAKKLLDISDAEIDTYVSSVITDKDTADKLAATLKARKQNILKKYSLTEEGVEDGGEGQGQPAGEAGPEGQGVVPEDLGPGGGGADGLGDSVGDSPWSSLGEPLPQADRVKDLEAQGLVTPELYELDPVKNAPAFRAAMEKLKENNPYAASVYVYDEEEYKQMRLFATQDGKAGFALKNGNEIVSVYVHSDSEHKGAARSLVAQGVALGGDRLDAFDTVLPKLYAKEGFKPISRVKWNDEFAPEGWDPELYKQYNNGKPDVVAMAYSPESLDSVYNNEEGEYFDDYDAALEARDKWVADSQLEPINASDEPVAITGGTPEEIKAQLDDAIANNKVISFIYNDKERLVRPESIWTNPKNGKVNLYAAEVDGIKKNFTISNIQASPAVQEESGLYEDSSLTQIVSTPTFQLKAGDIVITPKGEQKTVTKIFSTDSGDKISFDDNTSWIPNQDEVNVVVPATEESQIPELSGYTLSQTPEGVNYAPDITADDIYALRNGEKKPPVLPFVASNDPANGNAIYFDSNGTKRWGQFGAAGAVLKRETADGSYEVLVVKRSDATSTDQGVWSVPSGAHDTIESKLALGQTAKREVTEELGIDLGPSNVSSVEVQVSDDWAFTYDIINVDPSADFDGMVSPNKEISEYKWVSPAELKQMQSDGELHPAMNSTVIDEVISATDGTMPQFSGTSSMNKSTATGVSLAGVDYQVYPKSVVGGKVLRSTSFSDGAMTFGFGQMNSVKHDISSTISPNADGSFDAYANKSSETIKAVFPTMDSAKAWVGEEMAKSAGSETNLITNKPLGDDDAKPAQAPHKGGFLKPASEAQTAAIKKMLATKDVPDDKKAEIESALGKKDLVLGEAGQFISYLKSLADLPKEETETPKFEDTTVNPEVVETSLQDPELTPQKGSELASADDVLDPAKILEALKLSHKDSYELDNGDVALYSTTYTTGYGKSYKYELIARRTKKERFFAYVRETDIQTGTVRVFKATKEVHSYKAAMSKLTSAKKGLTSGDPRNWFNKLSKAKVETVLAKHDLTDIVDQLAGSKNGPELQSSLEDLVAGLGGQSFNIDKKIIEKLQKNSANLPAGFIDNVIAKMVDLKAKDADNISDQILGIGDPPPFPHMSYNGQQLNVGDYVDWTDISTGKVYRGKVQHVKFNHSTKGYIYSDQTIVSFPDLVNDRWRVSSNLVKVNKDAPMSEPFFAKLEENVEQQLTPVLSTTAKPDIDLAKQKAVENYKAALDAAKLVPSQPDIDLTPAQEAGLSIEMTTPDVEVSPQPNGSVVIGDESSGTYTIVQPDGTKTYYLNDVPIAEQAPKTADVETVDAVEDVVSSVTALPENTVDAAELGDALGAAQKAASELPTPANDPTYGEHNVKILGPDDVVTTGGKKAKFKYLKSVSEIQVGDVLRKAVGDGKYFYQVLEIKGRNKMLVRLVTPTTSQGWTQKSKPHGEVKEVWMNYYDKKHVYRPTEAAVADGYFKPKAPKAATTPVKVNSKGLNIFGTSDELIAQGVSKKSEESNSYFGITGEISDMPYNELAVSTNSVTLWKEGFDSIKVKTANNKYVIPGAIVTDLDGNSSGVVISTNKDDSELSVVWLSGPKASTSDTTPSSEVNDTENWLSPEKAKSLGVTVDEAAISGGKAKIQEKISQLEASNASFIESKKKEIEYKKLKKKATVKGTGAKSVELSKDVSWSSSDFDKADSLDSTLISVASNDSKGASGQEVLIDSGDIEDNRVRVYTVYGSDGKKETRLAFTLTSWATDTDANADADRVGIVQQLQNNPDVKKSNRLEYRQFQRLQNKLVENGTWSGSYIDNGAEGTTYSVPLKDASGAQIGTIRLHRANKDGSTPKFLGQSSAPIAYHNKVDISIDGDATAEQVELALKQLGVSDSRPATKEDIKVLAENKLIGLFGQKADGSINFEGELREKILEDVKAKYGVTAEDLEVVQDQNGEIQFLMPEEFGKKMAEITNTKVFSHSWNSSMPSNPQERADFLFSLLSDDGLRATTYRWASGINTSGMSSTSDGYRVGANYVFTRKNPSSPDHNSSNLSFHFDASQMLRRLDFYANNSDNFGAKSEKDMLAEISNDYVYEILFKGNISWADLAVLSIDSKTREILLEKLLNQGTTHFGDKPIQDVLGVTK